jgi:hypothetical protein
MEKRDRSSSSKELLKHSGIRQKTEEIILNYGVEIEAVFELINVYTAYNQFINFYLNYKECSINKNRINSTIKSFIKILKLCIDNHQKIPVPSINQSILLLQTNDIYISLTLTTTITPEIKKIRADKIKQEKIEDLKSQAKKNKEDDSDNDAFWDFVNEEHISDIMKTSPKSSEIDDEYDDVKIEEFLNTHLQLLINESKKITHTDRISEEAKTFIRKWHEFLNLAITIIIPMYHGFPRDEQIIIDTILNISDDLSNTRFITFQKIFDLTGNEHMKFYDIVEDIQKFYTDKSNDDEIFLCLTTDMSVVCNNINLYKNIKSGQVVKYNYLLNNCEFITQPFKNIDAVKNKLSIFFNDPIIANTILNCSNTSQHVHISFNNSSEIIRPDIYLILSILCVSLYFQDEIFKLFLITRTDNIYCKKLNYTTHAHYNLNTNDYNDCLFKLCSIFNDNPNEHDYHRDDDDTGSTIYNRFNRYYWLNIINLFQFEKYQGKPYTIEFRLKHGSNDEEELGNVCKLYENIINYANKLLKDIKINSKTTIDTFKTAIFDIITREDKDRVFNQIILKDIVYYFTNPNSNYVKGLLELNRLISYKQQELRVLLRLPITGGISGINSIKQPTKIEQIKRTNITLIKTLIINLKTKPIFKKNSFGYEYIGHGLYEEKLIEKMTTKFQNKQNLKNANLEQYLNLHNIFY